MANVTSLLTSLCDNFKNSASTSNSGTLPSQTVTNPRQQINAITTRSGKTLEEPSIPLVPTPDVSIPQNEPNPETSTEKVQNPKLEITAHVHFGGRSSIFIENLKKQSKKENHLVEMPKFNKWLSSLLRNKEKLEEIAITTVNAECSAIIMNKVPEKLEDPGKFLIPCALQELKRTSALADSGASINLLPHSIYKKLELEALTPTRMTLELANRSISHPMGIAEDVVVRVDGFTFLADFVEKLTLRVGKDELVYYADKSEKNKEKNFVHAISVIDFSKDDPFSGSTTTHSDDPSPSSSPVKTSDNFVKFAIELGSLLIRYHRVMMIQLLDGLAEEYNDEIDDFLAIEVSSNLEEGYFDSEGDIAFLDNLLSDDDSHNLDSKVTSDHEPEQNESSITFSPRSDPLHHEFADDDSEDEVNESPNLDHQDDPSIPRPPPEPPDIEKCFPDFGSFMVQKLWKDKAIPTISIDGLQSSLHKVGNLLSLSLSN
ncbi:reverse transcriptase domain-containing protein [Tanacetum coccineum]